MAMRDAVCAAYSIVVRMCCTLCLVAIWLLSLWKSLSRIVQMNSGVSAAIAVFVEVDLSNDKAADAEDDEAEDSDGLLQRFELPNNE